MKLSFAPMEGITQKVFRQVHHSFFPEADVYYSPFIAPDSQGNFKLSYLRDVLPDNNRGIRLIPQILANNADAFLAVARQMKELGYEEVNLNAGCPSGTVVSKHKGAGMLADLNWLEEFLSRVFEDAPLKVSVKTRMGMESTAEFEALMAVYEKFPIHELIIHARARSGMYKSAVDREAYRHAAEKSGLSLAYNGDVFTVSDFAAAQAELGSVEHVMLGRGAVTDPALFRRIKGGEALKVSELREFSRALVEENLAIGMAEQHTMMRMKELWHYFICLFPDSAKAYKALNRSRCLADYMSAAEAIFANCEFDSDAGFAAGGF